MSDVGRVGPSVWGFPALRDSMGWGAQVGGPAGYGGVGVMVALGEAGGRDPIF
jgi:hypothetical protein